MCSRETGGLQSSEPDICGSKIGPDQEEGEQRRVLTQFEVPEWDDQLHGGLGLIDQRD